MVSRSLWLGLVFALAFLSSGDAQVCATHTYLGNNPDEGNPGWHEEAQGLTHDADYWYITQNPPLIPSPVLESPIVTGGPRLWRIPVTHDLASGVSCGSGGVSCNRLLDTPLFTHGYNHFGDPDYYELNGRGYVLVPIENGDQGPGVALFRADTTLAFLAFAAFPPVPKGIPSHSGWVAVDPSGLLLASEGESVTQFDRFYVDWAAFQAAGEHDFALVPQTPILLQDESGAPLELAGAQGGEFSDDGTLLYFSNGYGELSQATWGVHVFATATASGSACGSAGDPCTVAKRVEHSHNGPGGFAYEFNHSDTVREEPEGLTFWDLDADGRAPGLRGQLHVVLLDNDALSADDVYVKHYRLSLEDSTPPVLTCPADVSAQCSAHTGTPATDPQLSAFLAGAVAADACDASPVLTHDAPLFFPLGVTPVTFSAGDQSLNSSSCTARVSVVDSLPPEIACPAPAVVECTGPQGIAAADQQLDAFFAGEHASDVCDSAPMVSDDAPASFPIGTTPVTFTARDASGNVRSCGSSVRVGDTVAPRITLALDASTLWPPNHTLIPIQATVSVEDRCDAAASWQLASVTSSEPDDGLGDGDTPGDIQGVNAGTADNRFSLRAERSGSGRGRVYAIVYRATDSAGNSSTATALVSVPYSR